MIGSLVNPHCNLGVPEPWSLEWLTGNVDDPPVWCGAAATSLCGEEDPSSVEKLQDSGGGIKVTGIEGCGEPCLCGK